jgi:phasin family protein
MTAKTMKDKGPEAAAKAAAETIEAMMAVGKENAEAAVKAGADAATEAYETAVSFGEAQMKKSTEGYKTATKFGKDNIASMSAAAAAVTTGMEAYGEQVAAYVKTAADQNFEMAGKFMSAKTPEEFAALQLEAATKSVDRVVNQSVALNKIVADMWMQSAAPMKERFDAAMQAFTKAYAA